MSGHRVRINDLQPARNRSHAESWFVRPSVTPMQIDKSVCVVLGANNSTAMHPRCSAAAAAAAVASAVIVFDAAT